MNDIAQASTPELEATRRILAKAGEGLTLSTALVVDILMTDTRCNGKTAHELQEELARYEALYEHLQDMLKRNGLGEALSVALPKLISERDNRGKVLDHLLAHCAEPECSTCAQIICPGQDIFHFHHDGCPICDAHNQRPEAIPIEMLEPTALKIKDKPYLDAVSGPGCRVTIEVKQP